MLLAAVAFAGGGLIVAILLGAILAGVAFWLLSWIGVPQPLAALVAVLVFLLCVFGGI